METFEMLSRTRVSIAALVLLGIGELLLVDISGPYVRALNTGGSGVFLAGTFMVSVLSAAILGWSAMKLRLQYRELLSSGAKAGMMVGIAAGLLVAFFMLLFGMAGIGLPNVLPHSVLAQGFFITAFAHAAVATLMVMLYAAMGPLFGALAGIASAPYHEDLLDGRIKPAVKKKK